jgi:hypothetical protein
MKKLITLLLITALAGLIALPQPAAAGIQFGLKIGGNIAKPTGADAQDPLATLKSRVGFTGGIFLAFNFGSVLSIQPEILYTMKGASYVALDDSYTDKLYADYIEIPVLLKLKLALPVVQPFILAGPSVGFKLSEKLERDGVPLTEAILKNNDYGAVFGAGLNVGRNFMLDVRYSLGLQKVYDTLRGTIKPDIKNGIWAATIGIVF